MPRGPFFDTECAAREVFRCGTTTQHNGVTTVSDPSDTMNNTRKAINVFVVEALREVRAAREETRALHARLDLLLQKIDALEDRLSGVEVRLVEEVSALEGRWQVKGDLRKTEAEQRDQKLTDRIVAIEKDIAVSQAKAGQMGGVSGVGGGAVATIIMNLLGLG